MYTDYEREFELYTCICFVYVHMYAYIHQRSVFDWLIIALILSRSRSNRVGVNRYVLPIVLVARIKYDMYMKSCQCRYVMYCSYTEFTTYNWIKLLRVKLLKPYIFFSFGRWSFKKIYSAYISSISLTCIPISTKACSK